MHVFSVVHRAGVLRSVVIAGMFCCARANAQQSAHVALSENTPLRMNVDEVVVTFNAVDASGSLVKDLKLEEIRIRDNGVAPRRVVAFEQLRDRPLRAGFLLDTSESMRESLPGNKVIAKKFVERLFRHGSDAAFVSSFGYGSKLLQAWSDDPGPLMQGIELAGPTERGEAGTAILNGVFQACSSSFAHVDPTATGNFILLFSDGQDNAGLTSADEAVRACQRSNTEVFAFVSSSPDRRVSTGPRLLRELAVKTGGRVFVADDSEESILADLAEIDLEMRNQYRLVYSPAELKHDGTFHEIELQSPDRVKRVIVRSGYFAPQK